MVRQPISEIRFKEKREIELQVLSPVHIGRREGRLTALEFIRDSKNVHLIDEEKFGRFLLERKLIDHFINEVKRGPVRMDRFLKEKARLENLKDLQKIVALTIPGGGDGMQEFRPFIRDGKGSLFIPGSSLKGVFRTAVLYKMVKSDKNLKEKIISKINNESEKDLGKKKKFFSEQLLQKSQLQDFGLPGAKQGPNQDIFRCFSIRDAYPFMDTKTELMQIHFLSKSGDGTFYWSQDKRTSGKNLTVWLEAVLTGKFQTEISWDKKLFEQFAKHNPSINIPVNSIDDLFKAVDEMNQDLLQEEAVFFGTTSGKKSPITSYKEYLKTTEATKGIGGWDAALSIQKWYQAKSGNLIRVGFGSGMLSTTVDISLPHPIRRKIRDACGSGPRPDDPAPKSRRVWKKSSSEYLPMGWLSLKVLS